MTDSAIRNEKKMIAESADQINVPGWLLSWVGVVASTLAGAVVFLFKTLSSNYAKQLSDSVTTHGAEIGELKKDRDNLYVASEQCQKDRFELSRKLTQLETRLEFLEPKKHD